MAKLKPGDAAPLFEMPDVSGNVVRLEDYKNKKLYLTFHRYASCILCNLRLHIDIMEKYKAFSDQGLSIVAFFQSSPENVTKYVGKKPLPFPLIADPQRSVYDKYAVSSSIWGGFKALFRVKDMKRATQHGFSPGTMDGIKTLLPASFLIGPDLTIGHAYYAKDLGDHMPILEIEKWLKENA